MVAHVKTVTFEGIHVTEVGVQVQISSGLPNFIIVGLPDKAVAESRERVRAAMGAIGLALPAKRIVVNLSPADLAKEGSHFDLPVALGLLITMGVVPQEEVQDYWVLGEISLDGTLLPVAGVLPAAMGATEKNLGIICPARCGSEARWAGDIPILAPSSLLSLINHFKGLQVLSLPEPAVRENSIPLIDMRDIRGQETARRALEVAAAGAHNLLMTGPPGAGKSMLASCLPGILPPMQPREILETSMVQSVAGKLVNGALSAERPFRDPHHTSSMAAMAGGGRRAAPGEMSLAHNGILFLDELPEFPRGVLETLRQPLETGSITVARAAAHVTYPANFQLIAAMNPCRCGYMGDASRACGKAPKCAVDYQSSISGPLLDRIDINIEVPAVDTLNMLAMAPGEPSEQVAARVAAAREIQQKRYSDMGKDFITNADADGETIQACALPTGEGRVLLEQATASLKLSMRGFTRVLRVARTIADLEASDTVHRRHIAEALSYRELQFGRLRETA